MSVSNLIPSTPQSTAAQLRQSIASGQSTARQSVQHALDRLAAVDPSIRAFLDVFPEFALAQADALDASHRAGAPLGPLAGVPVALKDNICLDHGKTTCGSKFLSNYHSPFAATAAKRLQSAGAIIIGKTNLDEFGMGSTTENSAFFPTKNPWDTSRVPGGSSGGSAAAVAAGIVPIALGSDTGGSIRQPASFCGVVGIKPTYGRVSRSGLVAYASSLDQIGPLASTTLDAALALTAISGHDPADSTSSSLATPDFTKDLNTPIENLRLAVPRQARNPANHPETTRLFEQAIQTYKSLGATIVDIDLPMTDYGIAAYYIVATAEASSNLARFDGVRFGNRAKLAPGDELIDLYRKSRAQGFGPEVQRRIMLGTHVLSSGYYDAYYNRALKVRRLIKRDFDAALAGSDRCHAVLMPTAPSPAFPLGDKTSDPLAMYLEDVYTVTINLAGLPAISIPAGSANINGTKLPVGVQLVGAPFEEATLLRIARMAESSER
jgi:aspartyl-tRNA(Asn)/glutamyl-tRNA(Gln) amidotransferase subunit A